MNMKSAILNLLNKSKPYKLPTSALRAEIEVQFRGRIGDSDFAEAVKALESKALIDHEVDPLTSDKRYWITGAGESYLAV